MLYSLVLWFGFSFAQGETRHASILPKPTPNAPCTLASGEIELPQSDTLWGIYIPPHAESADYDFVMSCKNCPKGLDRYQEQMEMSFSADKHGTNPPISLPTTTITSRNFNMRARSQVPAGFTATITAELFANGIALNGNTRFTFEVLRHTSNNRKTDTLVPSEICFLSQAPKHH